MGRTALFSRHQPGGVFTVENLPEHPGDIFFVDSTATSTGGDTVGHGKNPDSPFLTLDYAVGQTTANKGDVIYVMPGHTETVSAAAGLDLDVAGITIIFLGEGNARGCISFGTVVGADMDVDAADITLINPRFVAALDALTGPIDVNAARFRMVNATWQDGTGINTTDVLVADANADDMTIDGFEFTDGNAAGTQKQSFVQIAGATRPVLKRIRCTGDFGTGVIENGTAWIDALLEDIVIDNANAGPVVGILLQATSSGAARNVHVRVASGTTYVTANNDMQWFDSFGVGTDAAAGDQIGDVPSASIEGKIDTVQAELSGAAGLTTFPAGAAAANAVSLAEVIRYIQENIIVGTGTVLPTNQSLYDLLAGTNGIATWAAAAAPANGVSLSEGLRYAVEQQLWRLATKSYTFAGQGGAQGNINLFTVTGDVEIEIFGVAKANFTSGGAATISAGVAGNTAALIAQTTATDLIANEIWHDATPTTTVESISTITSRRFVVTNGQDIVLAIGTADLTAGDCTFYCRWRPLSNDGAVVAA